MFPHIISSPGIGILFTGYDDKKKADDIVFLCLNMHWENRFFVLPTITSEYFWDMEIVTDEAVDFNVKNDQVLMPGRSVAIFVAKKKKK